MDMDMQDYIDDDENNIGLAMQM